MNAEKAADCSTDYQAPLPLLKTVGVPLTLFTDPCEVAVPRDREEQSAAFPAFICG
jgi:hypothetical protein